MKKNFKLFMCKMGNGVIVCNGAVKASEDFKSVAHISDSGRIKWYVKPDSIPGDDLMKIEHDADAMRHNFLLYWAKVPDCKKHEIILDRIPYDFFMKYMNKEITKEQLEKYYLDNIA